MAPSQISKLRSQPKEDIRAPNSKTMLKPRGERVQSPSHISKPRSQAQEGMRVTKAKTVLKRWSQRVRIPPSQTSKPRSQPKKDIRATNSKTMLKPRNQSPRSRKAKDYTRRIYTYTVSNITGLDFPGRPPYVPEWALYENARHLRIDINWQGPALSTRLNAEASHMELQIRILCETQLCRFQSLKTMLVTFRTVGADPPSNVIRPGPENTWEFLGPFQRIQLRRPHAFITIKNLGQMSGSGLWSSRERLEDAARDLSDVIAETRMLALSEECPRYMQVLNPA